MPGILRRTVDKISRHSDKSTVGEDAGNEEPLSRKPDRRAVSVHGMITDVTAQRIGGVWSVEAELTDGSDSLTLIWLGRQHIAGIGEGRKLTVRGRIGRRRGQRVLFNPYYQLHS